MSHPTPMQLYAFLDGEAEPASAQEIRAHLEDCASCSATMARMRSLEQAIHATRPGEAVASLSAHSMSGLLRRVKAVPQDVQGILLVGPAIFMLTSIMAKMIIIAVLGDNLLQRAGLASSGPARFARWSISAATSPTIQRTVGDPLGLSQEQIAAAVTETAARIEGISLRPLVPALLLVIPMALISGIAILALSWVFCWTSGDRRE